MNLPNRLTLIRMGLSLVMAACLYAGKTAYDMAALIIFAAASLTDWLDGRIARKRNIITVLGCFLDPVADKFLILSAFIMLSFRGMLPVWAVIIVLLRELAVDSLRLVAANAGEVISAGIYGKVKTVTQMGAVFGLLASCFLPVLAIPARVVLYLAVIATLVSGVDYFIRNSAFFTGKKGEADA